MKQLAYKILGIPSFLLLLLIMWAIPERKGEIMLMAMLHQTPCLWFGGITWATVILMAWGMG